MLLVDILKPKNFDEVVGQSHLLSSGSLLDLLIKNKDFDSLCFYGPPGTGKTTVAYLISYVLDMFFYKFHAAVTGVNDIKKAILNTHLNGTLLVIDEVHHFNKSQQGILLDILDNKKGKIIITSTENPYHSLVPALRSRSYLFHFEPLSKEDLKVIFERAKKLWIKKNMNFKEISCNNDCLEQILIFSNGDARRFINILEAAFLTGDLDNDALVVNLDKIKDFICHMTFSEDEYYDLLSAMIKSIRGSDPDAALLWAFKMIKAGISPEIIFRRLLISASEDIGNAYPNALIFVANAYKAFSEVGFPEGNIIIAHTVTYLASCPKSNRAYMSYKNVWEYLDRVNPYPPENIRHNAIGYTYPFDEGGFVLQKYMDEDATFYKPSKNGFEANIYERIKKLWGDKKNF
jgi:putative ATPase